MTAVTGQASSWRSWHLHTRSLDQRELARLVTEAVGPLIDQLGAAGDDPAWFFVRYWQHGPHLRLRIRDRDHAAAAAIEADLAARLARVSSGWPADADDAAYQQAVAPIAAAGEGGTAIDPGSLRAPGVYREPYEPEYERYGGAKLMPVSERVFHASSVVALRVCRANGSGPLARGMQALTVSCAAIPQHPAAGDPADFLVTLRDRWTRWLAAGGHRIDPAAIDGEAGQAARQLAVARPGLLAAARGDVPARWSDWVAALRAATVAWQETLEPAQVRAIFGSHLHMMQNRLGVGFGREGYLAAILLHLLGDR
ncbi:MAG TPA: thiopeptide-type bacteriocin biosynthesis protein [Streptosporangiaceae bacterium]